MKRERKARMGLWICFLSFGASAQAAAVWQPLGSESVENAQPSPVETGTPVFHPSPGNMGPNAFSWLWRVQDARIVADRIRVDMGYRHIRDLRRSGTHTGFVRVEVPFSELASLEFEWLAEKWNLNAQAMRDYQARASSGFTTGDIVAGMRFNILKETRSRPAISLKGTIKTATGPDDDRRFTDTAGYEVSALFAKDVIQASGVLRKVRALAQMGFVAWDDGVGSQNDAYRYGLATEFNFASRTSVTTGVYGLTGWRKNGDHPKALYVEGRQVFSRSLSGFASVDLGLNRGSGRSMNPAMFSTGIRFQFLRKYKR